MNDKNNNSVNGRSDSPDDSNKPPVDLKDGAAVSAEIKRLTEELSAAKSELESAKTLLAKERVANRFHIGLLMHWKDIFLNRDSYGKIKRFVLYCADEFNILQEESEARKMLKKLTEEEESFKEKPVPSFSQEVAESIDLIGEKAVSGILKRISEDTNPDGSVTQAYYAGKTKHILNVTYAVAFALRTMYRYQRR
jgi:hypothetical protein